MKEQKWSRIVGLNVIGIFLYMVGIKCFAAPAKIAPGGASGIAILVNYVTGFPIGVFCTLFNFPILAVALYKKIFSPLFAVKSAGSIVLLSVMTDIIAPRIPHYQGNPLLAALFAGGFMGIGLALVYLGTSDTGGITMVGLIIKKHIPHLHVGTLVSAINILVVLVSGIVYRNAEYIIRSSDGICFGVVYGSDRQQCKCGEADDRYGGSVLTGSEVFFWKNTVESRS